VSEVSQLLANGSSRIGRFCGTDTPPVVTSMDNYLIVTFHADGSVAGNGFSASYVVLNASTGIASRQLTII
jgi:hypothetical protein